MQRGQTLKTKNGIEVVLFPMEYMNITQGVNGQFSHKGDMALDLAGKDTGIDEFIMPVTAKIVYMQPSNGLVVFESTEKVLYADGTIDYVHFLTCHDNYIGDLALGRVYKQGATTVDEGTKGYATGNHIHFVFGKGKSKGSAYPLFKNGYATWVLHNQIDPRKVCHINNTKVINTLGHDFKTFTEYVESTGELTVGATVKVRQVALKYATGQTIPSWVKKRTYKVKQIKNDRVLLEQINSWVYQKDIEVL